MMINSKWVDSTKDLGQIALGIIYRQGLEGCVTNQEYIDEE